MTDSNNVRIQREQRISDLRADRQQLIKWLEAIAAVGVDLQLVGIEYHGEPRAVHRVLTDALRDMEKKGQHKLSDIDRRISVVQQSLAASASFTYQKEKAIGAEKPQAQPV